MTFPYPARTIAQVDAKPPSTRMECRRHVPADFVKLAPTLSIRGLAHNYRTSARVIRRWCAETGATTAVPIMPATPIRPVPADFAELAPTLSLRQLSKHYRAGIKVVQRWVTETGATPAYGVRFDARPVPDDFTTLAAKMFTSRLCAHYDCSPDAIKRWSRLTGVTPPKALPGRPGLRKSSRTAPKIVRPAAYRPTKQGACFDTLRRDTSTEGLAADHLRRFCAVYRCTERGRADQQGSHWRYGNAVLTGAEMIERAERNGFDPEGWKRLAA